MVTQPIVWKTRRRTERQTRQWCACVNMGQMDLIVKLVCLTTGMLPGREPHRRAQTSANVSVTTTG